ncbi:restriction endonuclease subunit S [Faecalibacillus intestinalis]|uniref:restriction endonuclease subunit S n=1 Tax=Faecalibacillus intestinalis TaxID=1982626 RepID=UPI0022E0BD18|nr:restriction endonuclease subunit S [Faecalibacillus intestinalis]
MEYKKLGNICNIVSGGTPSRSKSQYWDNGNIPWIKIRDIKSKYIEDSEEFITIEGLNNSSAKLLTKGTVLYTIFATLGEVGILKIDACANQAIAGLTVKDETKILPEYLYYYLKSKKNIVNKLGRGVAQNNINLSMLKEFEIEVIDIVKQNNIIKTLNYVDDIIKFKSLELKQLDELVKARFVELFGDPATNEYNWPMLNLENVSSIITYGLTVRPTYVNKGIDLISARELHKGFIEYEVAPKISFNDFQSLSDKGKPLKNDILFSKTGSIGHCALVDTDKMFAITQNAARLGLIIEKVNPVWLLYYLRMNYIQDWCKRHAKGNAVKDLQLKDIKAIPLFECPLELQNQFADFVKEVDKSRLEVQKSLKKTQELFDSLMQKYFG